MSEILIKGLEDMLVDLGEDIKLLKEFQKTYVSEYGEEKGGREYIKYLKSVEGKYYGKF
jgi:hypothetical protein